MEGKGGDKNEAEAAAEAKAEAEAKQEAVAEGRGETWRPKKDRGREENGSQGANGRGSDEKAAKTAPVTGPRAACSPHTGMLAASMDGVAKMQSDGNSSSSGRCCERLADNWTRRPVDCVMQFYASRCLTSPSLAAASAGATSKNADCLEPMTAPISPRNVTGVRVSQGANA